MKGATAEPDVKTMRPPSITRQRMIGRSQNFFRSLINDQSSIKNSPMGTPPIKISLENTAQVILRIHREPPGFLRNSGIFFSINDLNARPTKQFSRTTSNRELYCKNALNI